MSESQLAIYKGNVDATMKALEKAGYHATVGPTQGDAVILNVDPDEWEAIRDVATPVGAGVRRKMIAWLPIGALLALGAGGLGLLGILPASPLILLIPIVFGAIEFLNSAWESFRLHGRQLPRQPWEAASAHSFRVNGGKKTRWVEAGCLFVFLPMLGIVGWAMLMVWQ